MPHKSPFSSDQPRYVTIRFTRCYATLLKAWYWHTVEEYSSFEANMSCACEFQTNGGENFLLTLLASLRSWNDSVPVEIEYAFDCAWIHIEAYRVIHEWSAKRDSRPQRTPAIMAFKKRCVFWYSNTIRNCIRNIGDISAMFKKNLTADEDSRNEK